MNKKILSGLITASLLSATLAAPAFAHQQGDIIVRAGALMVAPNESSGDVLGAGEFQVDDNVQLGLNFTYMATDNIGIELVAASPFTHEISLEGIGVIAEASQLPPTLLAQYYFGDSGSKFRPYVGAGVNFTVFFDTEFNDTGTGIGNGLSDLDMSNSIGLAAQVGVDYKINDKWLVNASVMYADISTDVTFKHGADDVKIKTDIDPLVYMVSIGYVF
ncbi:outer membrane protein OmpW [Moritella sp. F3]|uniref:outer membrane protein OmpW n=1 Tax=Moritella sp. F3 TaxID=2718882 RepID=UPI0018E17B60|nr:outer membrane protein OmpW [Moritella sp. F3]GIC77844.1 outer membrane protein OmpW [Moritella sp. F1]GIC83015.1 outer membrane protein OmpW [Moritella sp. F3]